MNYAENPSPAKKKSKVYWAEKNEEITKKRQEFKENTSSQVRILIFRRNILEGPSFV